MTKKKEEAAAEGAAAATTIATAPKPTKEEVAAAKALKAAEAKAAKEAAKGPKQNGIERPKADCIIGAVWALLDAASAAKSAPAALADVKEQAEAAKINPATLRTQYARWRLFNGVKGRVAKPKAAESEQAAA